MTSLCQLHSFTLSVQVFFYSDLRNLLPSMVLVRRLGFFFVVCDSVSWHSLYIFKPQQFSVNYFV